MSFTRPNLLKTTKAMPAPIQFAPRVRRRDVLAAVPVTAVALATTAWPFQAGAQDTAVSAAAQKFSFDQLSDEMRALAAQPYAAPEHKDSAFDDLSYDDYRLISFRPEKARWQEDGSFFRLHALPMGWLFKDSIQLFEVTGDQAVPIVVTTDDFQFLNDLATRLPANPQMPGIAGFRLHTPLNRPDVWDEVVAFLGASYFRALGRGNAYGISARGLAINSGLDTAEEFPRFSRFYIEKPGDARQTITIYAALESPSVTGAYRFVITPGAETLMDVTARLFFRQDVQQLGVAPLTSMFLFSEKNRHQFDDFRPNVHDSDGLRIVGANGETIWRPLNNPPRLSGSYFQETSPRAFGLFQRDRNFENYQDPGTAYDRRPSLNVEPVGDWGSGFVRLFEIPTESEANDNIVAFWVPDGHIKAGDSREFSYRLRWGDLPHDSNETLAYVYETRAGKGGVAGSDASDGTRKFVVDFKGGLLGNLPADASVKAVVTITGGEIVQQTLQHISEREDIWRLVVDVSAQPGATVELSAHVAGFGRKLTELWLYQWVVA